MNFLQLVTFNQIRQNISQLISANLSQKFRTGEEQFRSIGIQFDREIERTRREVNTKFAQVAVELQQIANDAQQQLRKIDVSDMKQKVDDVEPYVEQVEFYRWIGGLCICSILALMVFCFMIGLCFGLFGKRPDYFEEDCCNRAVGAKMFCT